VSTRSSAPFPAGQPAHLDRCLNSPANVQQIGAEGETPCCCLPAVISLHLEGVAAHWAGHRYVDGKIHVRISSLNPHSRTARAPAVGPFPCPGYRRVGHNLDSRRARSHARWLGGRGVEGKPGASFLGSRSRIRWQRLPWRCGPGRALFRLADRPVGAKEALLHHHRRLPERHRAHRAVMERLLLLPVSFLHRMRHRRRIRRHQFDHPGADPGALPRPYRPDDQRQFLGRGGARRFGRGRAAQSGADLSGVRMAARLLDRRGARRGRLSHAHVDSRESPLARDPRAGGGRRGGRRRNRTPGFVPRARVSSRSPPAPPFACARATILRLRKCSTHSSGATA